jgi:hypothetical protein
MGFSFSLIKWIMSCVVSANLAILINGEPSTFFRIGRGLRQGCPLSPLLFILAMEALSLLLKSGQVDGKITGIKVSRTIKILHLLFVDDVLIMTNDSPQEWMEIKEILKIFCSASSLAINWEKSTFHFANLQQQTLNQLKGIFPHTFTHISAGFKYLGYFLKADSYKMADWNWLIAKVEKKIGHWCTRWLSLGGRYTLIKVVLEGQPIYWMALAAIPATVLTKLRQLTYKFLWSGCSDHFRQHLCNWEVLAKPKQKGGWGIQNLFLFRQALATNSLWRVLTIPSIWKSIIKDKYLSHHTVTSWLLSDSDNTRMSSIFWKNLNKSKHWITRWLCWQPGSGHSILLGRNHILGINDSNTLPPLVDHASTQQKRSLLIPSQST